MRPFRVLGIQQIALGAESKSSLLTLWVELLGLQVTGHFVSERENVDEDICTLGRGAHRSKWISCSRSTPRRNPLFTRHR